MSNTPGSVVLMAALIGITTANSLYRRDFRGNSGFDTNGQNFRYTGQYSNRGTNYSRSYRDVSFVNRARVDIIMAGTLNVLRQYPLAADAASTASLVRTPMTTLMADNGYAYDNRKLADSLQRLGISPATVDFNVMSHGHPDHQGNLALFTDGTTFISTGALNKYNTLCFHPLFQSSPGKAFKIDDWITIMSTGGGDTIEAISVIVQNADVYNEQNQFVYTGTVAMIGDLLFNSGDFVNNAFTSSFPSPDPVAKSQSLAALMCLNGANVGYIIPGHGGGFQVTQLMRNALDCAGVRYRPETMTMNPNWHQNRIVFDCNMIQFV